jgi:hypothetical protein
VREKWRARKGGTELGDSERGREGGTKGETSQNRPVALFPPKSREAHTKAETDTKR